MAEVRKTPGKGRVGRKSLGPRNETKLRYPSEIDLQELAKVKGYSNANQFVSDVLCLLAGRPDLATTKAYQGTLDLSELAQAS